MLFNISQQRTFIINIQGEPVHHSVPMAVFGTASFLAGALVLLLPDCNHEKLPETLEDVDHVLAKTKNEEVYVFTSLPIFQKFLSIKTLHGVCLLLGPTCRTRR
jgi:hypothetical protein